MLTGLFIVIGLLLIVGIWIPIEQKLLMTSSFTIKSDKLPKAFHRTDFVILTDLHNHTFGKNNTRLIRRVERLSPEFIIVAGDMINKKDACCPGNAFNVLSQLAKRYKIYYAYGNHEQRFEQAPVFKSDKKDKRSFSTWVEFQNRLTKEGVSFLDNESIFLEKGKVSIRITGVTIKSEYFEHGKQKPMDEGYLKSLLGEKPEEGFELLIAHSPLYFDNYTNWGADLIISGHMHGGLIRLPFFGGLLSPQVRFFPKYSFGLYHNKGSQMLVSRGLGSHSLMLRLFNIPEVVSVKLLCDSKEND